MKDKRRLEKSLLIDAMYEAKWGNVTYITPALGEDIREKLCDFVDDEISNGKTLEDIAADSGLSLQPLVFGNLPKKRYVDKSKAGREIPDQTAAPKNDCAIDRAEVSFLMDEKREETKVLFNFDFSQVDGITTREISRADIRFIMSLYTYVKWNQKQIPEGKTRILISANKLRKLCGYNTNDNNISQAEYETIWNRWARLAATYISADVTGQFIKKYNVIPEEETRIIRKKSLLFSPDTLIQKDKKGKKTLGQWYILPANPDEVSPLASYINSTLTNGAFLIENKYLALPGRYSDEKQAMLEYIICQIKLYQSKRRNSNSITYDDVFKKCGITYNSRKDRMKHIENISDILAHLKTTGLISGYADKITKAVQGQRGKPPIYKFTFNTPIKENQTKQKPAKP